jgi:hypothetical protein
MTAPGVAEASCRDSLPKTQSVEYCRESDACSGDGSHDVATERPTVLREIRQFGQNTNWAFRAPTINTWGGGAIG